MGGVGCANDACSMPARRGHGTRRDARMMLDRACPRGAGMAPGGRIMSATLATGMSVMRETEPKVMPPQLDAEAGFEALDVNRLATGASFARVAIAHGELAGGRAANLRFEEATITSVVLRATAWPGLTLLDTRLKGCDLSNADWRQASFHRVAIDSCNMTGVNLANSQLSHVRVERSKLLLAQFSRAKFAGAVFQGCDLEQADFTGADLRGVVFVDCKLREARLYGAKLAGADLRGSDLTALGVNVADLRGAKIDAGQLICFAPLLGVEIV
jgi:uncharacterized protein YjbI with pentapeptide repeats